MRLVVCDTGPVLHLAESESLDLLKLVGEVMIPAIVERELHHLMGSINAPWIQVIQLEPQFKNEALAWLNSGVLHKGEADALALCRQIKADWFLTDDASARVMANALGIEVHGSIGVILWAAAKGYISRSETEIHIERLSKSSLWISPRVLEEAMLALGKLF